MLPCMPESLIMLILTNENQQLELHVLLPDFPKQESVHRKNLTPASSGKRRPIHVIMQLLVISNTNRPKHELLAANRD
jgi:hypothetical protein